MSMLNFETNLAGSILTDQSDDDRFRDGLVAAQGTVVSISCSKLPK